MKLYFIALVPNKKLKKALQIIKEDFAEKYNATHALKLPPHITLLPPFKIPEAKEELLFTELEDFCNKEKPFTLELSGFGSFKPRVIFINVLNKMPVIRLFSRIKANLKDFYTKISDKKEEVYPHITIATRDLSSETFEKAWAKYRDRSFISKFEVKDLVLFRHNGKHWEKVKGSFTFNNKDLNDQACYPPILFISTTSQKINILERLQ